MLKAYKFRIYPNASQAELMAKHFGSTRHIYNWALSEKKAHYEQTEKTLPKSELQKRLVASKKTDKPWLKEVNSQSLLATLLHVETGFTNFFRGQSGFPKYKSRKDAWQSFQCPQHVSVDHKLGVVHLPKMKSVKAKLHRVFEGSIKTCTIKKSPTDQYYISILVEDHQPLPESLPIEQKKTVGVDVGIKDFAITDAGEKYANLRFLNQSLMQLRSEQRQLSRTQKGSNNRNKQRKIVAAIHSRVSAQRLDYHHKIANQLLNENQVTTVAFEDLHIKGMMKNKKLARHIADVAWSQFVNIVQYKAAWQGKNVIFCNRFAPSSKQCPCGEKNTQLKLSDRVWQCDACKTIHDRDVLAANNIKKFAIADALGQSVCVKQSPHGDRCSKPAMSKGQCSSLGKTLSGRKKPPLNSLQLF